MTTVGWFHCPREWRATRWPPRQPTDAAQRGAVFEVEDADVDVSISDVVQIIPLCQQRIQLSVGQTLGRRARRVDRRGRFAEQRSRDLGDGIEFRDFRPYASGDDFRAIDWNIYRRLGKVFLRLFEQIPRFSERSRLSTWLTRLTVNHVLNYLKSEKRRRMRRTRRSGPTGRTTGSDP